MPRSGWDTYYPSHGKPSRILETGDRTLPTLPRCEVVQLRMLAFLSGTIGASPHSSPTHLSGC